MDVQLLTGDCRQQLATLPDSSVHCCVTSPPYFGLRDYGHAGQIGLEPTPDAYVAEMVAVFREVRRVLRDDGTLWLNLGDSYNGSGGWGGSDTPSARNGSKQTTNAGSHKKIASNVPGLKPKDLCMIPARVALALQDDGWWLRSHIVWAKRAPMPESVTDRPTSAWESIFLLTKNARYFYDAEAVKEAAESADRPYTGERENPITAYPGNPQAYSNGASGFGVSSSGRNQRNVWHLSPEPYAAAHFATFPTEIPRRAILAGTSAHGCCAHCGAPWRRIVEREKTGHRHVSPKDANPDRHDGPDVPSSGLHSQYFDIRTATVGWEPTCTCGAGTVPATVLDPFAGSGTTLAVALSLGRRAIGIELNPAYAALARQRIAETQPALFGIGA